MSTYASKSWRAEASIQKVRELPQGLDVLHDYSIGQFKQHSFNKFTVMNRAGQVLKFESFYSSLSETELKKALFVFKEIFMLGREDKNTVNKAFAAVREACWRVLGMKPYKVQVAGGVAIESGYIADMSTGEGKTLTATLPGAWAGWRGRGWPLMTTNSYLAARDAEEMRPVYEYCGLTVSSLSDEMKPSERKQAYLADITYCTNKDVAADFLRDQLTLGHGNNGVAELLNNIAGVKNNSEIILRGLECAIVDEADSVLIDDGVTPL